ncbi:MAG: TIGR03620 family F420-dependent LLM class oxidoreductase [Actinomycetota bacterium]|nr:TIGR03620 family F420-dependent LLM class oxidoreductase [Actinomycetota bacterium]
MNPLADDLATLRRNLGPFGVWAGGPALERSDPGELAGFVEALGYTALWIGGGNPDRAAFARLATMLSATDRLVVATGIANLWAWDPDRLAVEASRLHASFPGRFLLGIGVSHAPLVERLGHRYERPVEAMAGFLDDLDRAAPAPGIDLSAIGPTPRVLAALGDRMLRLAAGRSHGAHPYLTTPDHTERARTVLGPAPLLAPEQALVADPDVDRGRRTARAYLERYLRLPNYRRSLTGLGFSEHDLDGDGSDRLVDAVVPHGSSDGLVTAARAHLDAGADHVCIQPLTPTGDLDRYALELLGPALRAVAAKEPPPDRHR